MSDKPQPAKPPGQNANTAVQTGEYRHLLPAVSEEQAKREMRRRSRRAFVIGAIAAIFGGGGYAWLRRPAQQYIFNRGFRLNERISEAAFSERARSPQFPRNQAGSRLNGMEGLSDGFDPGKWRLQLVGLENAQSFPNFSNDLAYESNSVEDALEKKFPAAPVAGLMFALAEIKALTRVEMVTELKCIEGWKVIVNWAGVRFSELIAKYKLNSRYVSLVTPDRGYYVGWDMASILHPETLLCFEMNGAPLTPEHGAPLRLVSTTKYGIKQIKRIGRITFTNERPPDYWAERGYDWYSGL